MVLEKEQHINSAITDSKGELSVIGSFQILQDAITELMGRLNADGFTARDKYNAIWVYTKSRIKFFKKVSWGTKITVSSFISYISLVKMNVDVRVLDEAGELVFYSRTELCALDITTQRIRKVATVGIEADMVESLDQVEIAFARFDVLDLPLFERVRVRSTSIDMSHHTNNIEYLRFILNTYSVTELEKRPIREIELIYSNQSFENDILEIKKGEFKDKDLITIEKEDKTIIKCEILY